MLPPPSQMSPDITVLIEAIVERKTPTASVEVIVTVSCVLRLIAVLHDYR